LFSNSISGVMASELASSVVDRKFRAVIG
jgi:hypothetical protein